MTNTAPQRWRGLTPEQQAAQRARERQGDILSRLGGIRLVEQPGTGWWLMRAVKGGPEVPASIQWERTECEPGNSGNLMDRSPILTARIAGKLVSWDRVWNWVKRPISRADHDYRLADMAWAAQHRPDLPIANPHKRLDWMRAEIPF